MHMGILNIKFKHLFILKKNYQIFLDLKKNSKFYKSQ